MLWYQLVTWDVPPRLRGSWLRSGQRKMLGFCHVSVYPNRGQSVYDVHFLSGCNPTPSGPGRRTAGTAQHSPAQLCSQHILFASGTAIKVASLPSTTSRSTSLRELQTLGYNQFCYSFSTYCTSRGSDSCFCKLSTSLPWFIIWRHGPLCHLAVREIPGKISHWGHWVSSI